MEKRTHLSNSGKECTHYVYQMFQREVWRRAALTGKPVFMYLSPEENIRRMYTGAKSTYSADYTASGDKFTTVSSTGDFQNTDCADESPLLKECFIDSLGHTDPLDALDATKTAMAASKENNDKKLGWIYERIRHAASQGEFSVVIPKDEFKGKEFDEVVWYALQQRGYKVKKYWEGTDLDISWKPSV